MDVGSLLGYDCALSNDLTPDRGNVPRVIQRPCVCQPLHNVCDPGVCPVAARAPFLRHTPLSWPPPPPSIGPQWAVTTSVKMLLNAAERGCPTCTMIYDALYNPGIYLKWDPNRSNVCETVKIKGRNGQVQVGSLGLDLISAHQDDSTCKAFALAPQLSGSTSSDESYSIINRWILECSQSHEARSEVTDTHLPARVLVIDDEVGKQHPRLHLLETTNEQAPYIALSYCWGRQKFITTTRENLHVRKQGIEWDQLPKTFQDAINITRRLQIQYLWIDSLCILQDDPEDWSIESAKMGSIYRHAYLTIAASHAKNVHGGCFASTEEAGGSTLHSIPLRDSNNKPVYDDVANVKPSGLSVRLQLDHTKFRDRPALLHGISLNEFQEPLSRRGWSFQERLLSKRIIHYTASELVWECDGAIRCQCERIEHVEESLKYSLSQSFKESIGYPNLSSQWIRVIEEFSERKLTVESDRLPALSGLAKQFQSAGAGRYYAGLWSENLLQLLHWRVVAHDATSKPSGSKKRYIAPSWSWASIDGRIQFPCRDEVGGDTKRRPAVRLMDIHCTPTTVDETGAVSAGYIRIAAYVIRTSIYYEDSYESWELVIDNKGLTQSFNPDVELPKPNSFLKRRHPVSCVLWSIPYGEGEFEPSGETIAYFMVLQQSPSVKGAYERLGMCYFSWDSPSGSMTLKNPAAGGPHSQKRLTAREWFASAQEEVLTIV